MCSLHRHLSTLASMPIGKRLEGAIGLVLIAGAALLETSEEGPYCQGGRFVDGRCEPFQPPAIGAEGGLRAATDLLGQDESFNRLVERVSVGFFTGF